MKARSFSAAIFAGVGLAIGAGVPIAQATEATVDGASATSASTHIAQGAFAALDARGWNAEAKTYKTKLAKVHTVKALPYLGRH
jgi:hypothetical protein